MKPLFQITVLIFLFGLLLACNGQTRSVPQNLQTVTPNKNELVGGGCDGCEIMFIGMPANINAIDTSAGWHEEGKKLLVLGKVFAIDGKTPAPDVIIYYWQTDNNGYYSAKDGPDNNAKRHGHIRGWVKTDELGNYAIYTIKPAPYPNEVNPAHIHLAIKEPDINNEYYIDEFVFDDDTLLTQQKRAALENRGGSGILQVQTSGNLQIAKHNIILGLHIPNYPISRVSNK